MVQILFDEYKKHKKFVLLYVGLCVFMSVFCGPFLENWFSIKAHATETLTEGETLSTLTTAILGNSISAIAGSYSSVVAISCEPFTALLFLGIIENINNLCGNPLSMVSTPAGNPVVLAVITVFFIASKLMKSNETTQVFGMVTLGELEKYLGLVFILVLGILNVTGLSTAAVGAVVMAASPETAGAVEQTAFVTVISVIFSVMFAVLSLAVYFIMKTVMAGLDVVQMGLSFIPGSSFFFETCKTLFAAFLVIVNVICPPLGIAFNIIVFIIGCILFKYCYRAGRYFENIYVKPIFKRIKGFDPKISFIHKKLPKKLKKYFEKESINPNLAIPVYPLKYVGEEKVHKFDRWWLVSDGTKTSYIRTRRGKKRVRKLTWKNTYQQTIYIRKGLWSYEIFSYISHPDNMAKKFPKKEFSFALSMEYMCRLEEILQLTGYTDYTLVQEERKLTRKQLREEKRALRKEFLLQKKEEIKLFFKGDNQEY